jgi:hypothetical protein
MYFAGVDTTLTDGRYIRGDDLWYCFTSLSHSTQQALTHVFSYRPVRLGANQVGQFVRISLQIVEILFVETRRPGVPHIRRIDTVLPSVCAHGASGLRFTDLYENLLGPVSITGPSLTT